MMKTKHRTNWKKRYYNLKKKYKKLEEEYNGVYGGYLESIGFKRK